MEQLHEHNQKTYENICRMSDEGIGRVAIVQPTGSGKSLLMAKLIEDNSDSRFFVLSTSHKINDQFKTKLDERTLKRVDFNIYCNMPNMNEETMKNLQPDYILLDEMHRALAKEWSKGINVLLEMYPNTKVLGLSATPIRYLDRCRNVVNELFNGNLACDMSLSQAILDGILPMARYVCGVYSYEKDTESLNKKIEKSTNSDEEKKKLLKEVKLLKENLDKGHGVSDIFKKYVVNGNEKFVVFLKNTTHLREMKPVIEKWFIDAGFSVRMYEVNSKNMDKDKEFQAFTEDKENGIVKLCLSVAMLTEGIHGDIDGVIMLRETISPNMYFQMIGRVFSCGKKTIPLIFDLVANSQFISGAADNFTNELKGEIEKRKKECEKEGKEYEVDFDVNEFIVMDYFMDVVSGFKAIEERLAGRGWDLYIKALKQYKEREGDCLVPPKHIEFVDGKGVSLGQWCLKVRNENKSKKGSFLLTQEMKKQLNKEEFIWDANVYRFKANIMKMMNYCEKYGEYPKVSEKSIGSFILKEKKAMQKLNYPEWKMNLIEKYIPGFSWDYNSEKMFERFIYYANVYRERYGHINIKFNDVIDGYNIGAKLGHFNSDKLSKDKIDRLNEIGIFIGDRLENRLNKKMELAQKAIEDGVIIKQSNPNYADEDFYHWIMRTVRVKYQKNELTQEQIAIIEKLIDRPLDNLFGGKLVPTKVVDVIEDREIGIFTSRNCAAKYVKKNYGFNLNNGAINLRLTGKITTPYKGRFMFYYATDEEVKKYFKDSKVS